MDKNLLNPMAALKNLTLRNGGFIGAAYNAGLAAARQFIYYNAAVAGYAAPTALPKDIAACLDSAAYFAKINLDVAAHTAAFLEGFRDEMAEPTVSAFAA
jgi:hypothetical protein